MWKWKLQCLSIIVSLCPCTPYIFYNNSEMRWVDQVYEPAQRDTFFDRIVMIVLNETNDAPDVYMKNHSLIAPGVFINANTVLTSYNPFRKIIKDKERRKRIVITHIDHRIVQNAKVRYELAFLYIACARQIIPMLDEEHNNVWHGGKQDNSPLHDLMVIRVNRSVHFTRDHWLENYNYEWARVKAGPLLTILASPNEPLTRKMRYASAGYRSNLDIWKWCCIRRTIHEDGGEYKNLELNCDKWLPREWGHFICIDNIHDYPGLGSGAILVGNNGKLYGVGSFMLKRGGKSIMVFTDVRRYHHLVFKTCSRLDQDLGVTTTTTTTTTTITPITS